MCDHVDDGHGTVRRRISHSTYQWNSESNYTIMWDMSVALRTMYHCRLIGIAFPPVNRVLESTAAKFENDEFREFLKFLKWVGEGARVSHIQFWQWFPIGLFNFTAFTSMLKFPSCSLSLFQLFHRNTKITTWMLIARTGSCCCASWRPR